MARSVETLVPEVEYTHQRHHERKCDAHCVCRTNLQGTCSFGEDGGQKDERTQHVLPIPGISKTFPITYEAVAPAPANV